MLDDDATECPFCGANMKAPKGSASPKPSGGAPKAAATRGGSAGATAAASRASAGKAAEKKKADSDDPFAFDSSITEKGVIPLLPRPQKGRAYKIVCPMCETPGFSSTKAAGRQVKCVNNDCMVPVFTAPKLETKPEPTETEEPESKTGRYVMLALIAVVGIGLGVWYSTLEGPRKPADRPDPRTLRTADTTSKAEDEDYFANLSRPKAAAIDYQALSIDEVRTRALDSLVTAAQQRENNRSQTLCRRLASESFAAVGNLKAAEEHLVLVKKDTRLIGYFPIPPLIDIAWLHLEQNAPQKAAEAVNEAVRYAEKLPRRGRTTEIITTQLAAGLAATGQVDVAKQLLDRLPEEAKHDNLGVLTRLALAAGEYDLDRLALDMPLVRWTSANDVIVTADIARHRQWKAAETWVKSLADNVARMESVAEWAQVQIRLGEDKAPQSAMLAAIISELSPSQKAYVWSRMGQQHARSGNQKNAQTLVEQARNELAGLPAAQPATYDTSKAIHNLSAIRFDDNMLSQMRAWAEVAFAESLLGRPDQSWDAVSKALDYARALAPSPTFVQNRSAALRGSGGDQMRRELQQTLDLKTDDQARLAATRYQRNLDLLSGLADQRFQFQVGILDRASHWNLGSMLVDELLRRSSATADAEHEPYLQEALPQWILFRARKDADGEQYPQLEQKLVQAGVRADLRVMLADEVREAINAKNYDAVESILKRTRADKEWINLWTLQLACRLCREHTTETSVRFLLSQADLATREEGFYFVGGTAVETDQTRDFFQLAKTEKLIPTEIAHACAGLIAGLSAKPGK